MENALADNEKLYAFFYETVLCRYAEYKTIRKERKAGTLVDWKAAIDAATAAYHFREHLPNPHHKTKTAIAAICPDYFLLGDVVDAAKHKVLTRKQPPPQIASADSIREQVVFTGYEDEGGEYKNASKSIEITLKDGSRRELFDVLTNVVNMWIDFLQAAGISGKAKLYPHEDRNRISREEAGTMDLTVTQGIAAELPFKYQKYNYEKGLPEPVDLTGSKFSFTVYDPAKMKVEVAMQAVSPEGKEYVGSVELDAEENREFFLLRNEVQPGAQDAFIQKIMERRGELVLRSGQTDLPGPEMLIAKFNQSSDHEEKAKPEKPESA